MQWKYKTEHIPPGDLSREHHPVIEALLLSRGYREKADQERFFSPSFERDLHDPFLFSHMARVVEALGAARDGDELVGIFGDFDADGVTSSVIMREALEGLGIRTVVYLPDKISEGHGLNMKAVDFFELAGAKLVLTLDCGMTNHAEISEAKRRGIAIIVIDHHHVPPVLPEALAIVNPKLPSETYPFRELCGAGTSFKVAQALYRRFRPESEEQLKWLLDVAATGTVADVMPLVGENRTLVKYGLIVLSKSRRPGLQELFRVGRIQCDDEHLPDAHTIGFQIAPRINAASRMAHARLAHDLLMEKDRERARALATELDGHNSARQKLSTDIADQVRALAGSRYKDKKFIFAADPKYPYGIVGLIAGRIANEFRKPTCILTKGETESRGSFRSIPELNIIEAIEECGDLLEKFGGHAQAAGMTIKNDRLDVFYERFNALVEKKLAGVVTEPELWIEGRIRPEHITSKLLFDLSRFAPFGEGNPEPLFALEDMRVAEVRRVGNGEKHLKLVLCPAESEKRFSCIGFSLGEVHASLLPGDRVDAAIQICENVWNGVARLELKIVDLRRK